MAIILPNLYDLHFFTGRYLGKFTVGLHWLLTIPPLLAYVTMRNISVRKQAINGKLQSSVATYLRCSGVFIITELRKVYC